MAAKKHALKLAPQHPLTKAEACRALQVAPTADGELITKAYWHLARKYRITAHRGEPEARRRLDELNRAYRLLNPAGGDPPLAHELPPITAETEEYRWADQFFANVRRVLEETAARWPGRTAEMAVLAGTTVLLGFLALSTGASPLWTLLAGGIALLTIWAPWRRI